MFKKFFIFFLFAVTFSARADWIPTQPVRVLSSSPGGVQEVLFRRVARIITETTGANFVIESKPGAEGVVAWNELAQRPADGHHAIIHTVESAYGLLSFMYPKSLTTSPRQHRFVTSFGTVPWVFVVANPSKIQNLDDLIASYRNGSITVGTVGTSGMLTHHYFAAAVNSNNNKLIQVPYKASPASVTDMLAGSLDVSIVGSSNAKSLAEAGKIRIIGSTITVPDSPTIPSVQKQVKDFDIALNFFLALPSGTSDSVVNWYRNQINLATGSESYRDFIKEQWGKVVRVTADSEGQTWINSVVNPIVPVSQKVLKPQE